MKIYGHLLPVSRGARVPAETRAECGIEDVALSPPGSSVVMQTRLGVERGLLAMVPSVVDKHGSCWKSLQAFPLDEAEFLVISSGPNQKQHLLEFCLLNACFT